MAPFEVSILNLKPATPTPMRPASDALRGAHRQGIDVLYDDTDERPGAKFATADLIGVPWQILVGPKGLADGKVELKRRADGSARTASPATRSRRLIA